MKYLTPILSIALVLVLFTATVGFVIHRSDSDLCALKNKHLDVALPND